MIVDSSAILAILRRDPDASRLLQPLLWTQARRMSAATYVEVSIVIDRSADPVVRAGLEELMARLGITIEAVTAEQARVAREAHRSYGRGTGHPARLNFGDCFAYALAKTSGEQLLYTGRDFDQTDVGLIGPLAERKRLSEARATYGATEAPAQRHGR
ncbi:MAG: type II toxin-antitoxin system VapC family toxin [Chloroflexi bacterium]|nr:type II toxin-antitoxin system VapC family toxin [Chloroflexota bacterium]